MQSVTTSHQQVHTGLRMKSLVKFVIPILFLLIAVAVYELSTAQLIILALLSGLLLALLFRIENMLSVDANEISSSITGAGMDGGSFHHQKSSAIKTAAVITDGGSFERASAKHQNRA